MQLNYATAIEDYNHALQIKKASDTCAACAYRGLGEAYSAQGQFDLPIDNFTKAIDARPDFVDAYVGRGKAYQKKGDQKSAQSDFDRARSLGWAG